MMFGYHWCLNVSIYGFSFKVVLPYSSGLLNHMNLGLFWQPAEKNCRKEEKQNALAEILISHLWMNQSLLLYQ